MRPYNVFHVFHGEQGHSYGSRNVMICRNCNLSAHILFKGSDDGLIEGYAALEKDVLADRLARNDAIDIVLDHSLAEWRTSSNSIARLSKSATHREKEEAKLKMA